MTENQLRKEIVDQAKSWVGRKEADGTHRVIIDVYNSTRTASAGRLPQTLSGAVCRFRMLP